MPLARIITRSDTCARELALHLLGRGYAVEIVSPDSIPDNLADLELRVDPAPGDQLIASVRAQDGERSSSLEFVHHLKTPMADFIRRPPEPCAAPRFPVDPVSFDAEPSTEDFESLAEVGHMAAEAHLPSTEIPVHPELISQLSSAESTQRHLPTKELPLLTTESAAMKATPSATLLIETTSFDAVRVPPSDLAPDAPPSPSAFAPPLIPAPSIARPTTTLPTIAPSLREAQPLHGHSRWLGRAAATIAALVLVVLFLGFGIRRTSRAPAESSRTVASIAAGASTAIGPEKGSESDPGKDQGMASASAVAPSSAKSEADSGQAPKESSASAVTPVVKTAAAPGAGTSKAGNRTHSSRKRGEDLVAHDTVTYLDERYKPSPKTGSRKHEARRHPSAHKHSGGVIAANRVTYLDGTSPASKSAKK